MFVTPISHNLCQLSPKKFNDSFFKPGQEMAHHQHRQNTLSIWSLLRILLYFLRPETSPIEIYQTIKNPYKKRSVYMFELSNVVLKTVNTAICVILFDVFNNCFNFMYISEILKRLKWYRFIKVAKWTPTIIDQYLFCRHLAKCLENWFLSALCQFLKNMIFKS